MNKSALSALLGLTVLVAGCSTMKTPSDLLMAPSQGSADGTITSIVQPYLPAGAHLTVPVQSESSSAIQLQDLDKDGQEEILAFYKTDKTGYEINALVLSKTGGEWKKLINITGVGSELDYVKYADVTGDGAADVLLGFSGGEGLGRELSVYSLSGGQLSEILKQPYDYLAVGDMTDEGKTDIALIHSTVDGDNQPESHLQLLRLQGGKMQSLSDQNISGMVIQAMYAKAAPAKSALIIDAAIGAHSSYTSLLTWANGSFTDILASDDYQHPALADSKNLVLKPLAPEPGGLLGEHSMAIKDYPLYSEDVNGDGIVEIGFLVPPAGAESFAPLATPFITKYYQWDGQTGLKLVQEQFDRWGFNFHIPASWTGKYLLDLTGNESPAPWEHISFSYKDANSGEKAQLLELRLLAKKDWQTAEAQLIAAKASYKLLYELQNTSDETAPTVFVAVLPSANAGRKLTRPAAQEYEQLKLTLEEVRQLAGTPQKPRP
ncbi:VCBS repeat-containing protein [Paenibacillus riograndensis]|uniref:Putative secreted protein n=1 Tax=Paenibacillus riograndensis SBR5 TaxID=1073571 RepID=A0A0E4HET4_9BACL|nr:VCBS repeat-containing protein [Paenibacillus riograndensis]CQR58144.1 putative secreted protein [Paenibacillus riograndensis SBR5]